MMLKQKTKVEIASEFTDETAVISTEDDDSGFASLAASLAQIRKLKSVFGYILRSNTSAIIDLAEQDKIIEYATLSSKIAESSLEMAKEFNLSDVESVLVEGKNVKVLCMSVGENKISVFMEKTATHASIIKRVLR
jgi:predicted regulator of Ras-like GTPase activity (Roadblock/LC7/MglB family)